MSRVCNEGYRPIKWGYVIRHTFTQQTKILRKLRLRYAKKWFVNILTFNQKVQPALTLTLYISDATYRSCSSHMPFMKYVVCGGRVCSRRPFLVFMFNTRIEIIFLNKISSPDRSEISWKLENPSSENSLKSKKILKHSWGN